MSDFQPPSPPSLRVAGGLGVVFLLAAAAAWRTWEAAGPLDGGAACGVLKRGQGESPRTPQEERA